MRPLLLAALVGCGLTGNAAEPQRGAVPGPGAVNDAGADADAAEPGKVALEIQVRDAATRAPLPKAIVVLDLIPGLHALGGIATADGLFDIFLPPRTASVDVRAFIGGHRSTTARLDLTKPDAVTDAGTARWVIDLPAIAPSDVGLVPRTSTFTPSAASVGTGDALAFTAVVIPGTITDPVSKDLLLVDPNHYTVTTLAQQGNGSFLTPSGFSAPREAGTFTYYLAARTEDNVGDEIAGAEVRVASKQPSVHFKATIVDAATQAPLAGALVAIEIGARPFADTSRPSPYFELGALAASDGTIDVVVPGERISAHALASGYARADAIDVDPAAAATIKATRLAAPQLVAKPLVTGFAASPTIVPAGTPFDVSAQVAHGPGDDPLSDQVLVVEATTGSSSELAPPGPGRLGQGYPDGAYTRRIAAPKTSGTYTYRLVAVSQGGVPSDPTTTTITVP